jgi:DNA repair protein RadC
MSGIDFNWEFCEMEQERVKRIGPREKLRELGPAALKDSELLMVILGSGSGGYPVRKVAARLKRVLRGKVGPVLLHEVEEIPGIGLAKGAALLASLELARRRTENGAVKIRRPQDVLPLVHDVRFRTQEHFVVVSLNGNHEVVHTRVVTVGLANYCQIHPREVFADVIQDRGTSVLLVHNHPSGNLEASKEDREVTERLAKAGRILGITVLDHIIVSKRGFYSIREEAPELFRA